MSEIHFWLIAAILVLAILNVLMYLLKKPKKGGGFNAGYVSVDECIEYLKNKSGLSKNVKGGQHINNPNYGYWECPIHGTGERCCMSSEWVEIPEKRR